MSSAVHKDWLVSKTTMIAKNNKPTILEFRPIAVTTWSSKIACTYYRERIEDHLKENAIVYENQYRFTRGIIEDCMFTLKYVAKRTFESKRKEHKSLYFTFMIFKII